MVRLSMQLGATAFFCTGTNSFAQDEFYQRNLDEDAARKASAQFAQCVVKDSEKLALRYVLSFADITLLPNEFRALNRPYCVPGGGMRIKLPGDMLSYVLSDALVRKLNIVPRAGGFGSVPALKSYELESSIQAEREANAAKDIKRKTALQAFSTRLRQEYFTSQFGECVARQQPELAYGLLQTKVATEAETDAFSKLQPSMSACLSSGQVRFSRAALRGGIALSYVRLAYAPTSPSESH